MYVSQRRYLEQHTPQGRLPRSAVHVVTPRRVPTDSQVPPQQVQEYLAPIEAYQVKHRRHSKLLEYCAQLQEVLVLTNSLLDDVSCRWLGDTRALCSYQNELSVHRQLTPN